MEVQGFCLLKKDADCKHAMGDPKTWQGQMMLAMEINESTKSVLVLRDAEMGMFDLKDVRSYFKCRKQEFYLFPEGLNIIEQMAYMTHVQSRNGGYNEMCMKMVIASSLHKGEFTDTVLWTKGQDPNTVAAVNALKQIAKERTEKIKV
jgi:hypothetical protein